jgi:hypothetical protein
MQNGILPATNPWRCLFLNFRERKRPRTASWEFSAVPSGLLRSRALPGTDVLGYFQPPLAGLKGSSYSGASGGTKNQKVTSSESSSRPKMPPAGAGARRILVNFTARLKSCPDTKQDFFAACMAQIIFGVCGRDIAFWKDFV